MDCLFKKKFLFVLLSVFLFFTIPLSYIFASDYLSAHLEPAEGTITADPTPITLHINSGESEYVGIDAYISFSGPIEYVSSIAVRCSADYRGILAGNVLNTECIHMGDGTSHSGAVVTMYFKATGEGTATFTITDTDIPVATKTGSSYSVVMSSSGNGGANGGANGDLPEAGIFDSSSGVVLAGIVLIILGILFNSVANVFSNLTNSVSLLSQKAKKARVDKRRGKLEKRF